MKRLIRAVLMVVLLTGVLFAFTACGEPQLKDIEASQTAFLIPMTGDTTQQGKLNSEEFLKTNEVAGKRVMIPMQYIDKVNGWQPTVKLIIVERKPETREWTESKATGTSSKNEGVSAESKESIGFMARMNCSAQIDEADAVRFLYRYNSKPLSEIMDSEIRARIESKFVESCAKYTLEEILLNKEAIMKTVRDDVITYFKERGITISVIGLKGEFTYLNPEIQKSIDEKFKSAQALVTQKNENERVVSKAKADAESVQIQAQSIEKTIQLKELENQTRAIDKWDGKMPQYSGSNGSIFNIPVK